MPAFKDITGEKHGNLTVLGLSNHKYITPKTGQTTLLWRVKCELCGRTIEMQAAAFKKRTSCGCDKLKGEYKKCVICGAPFYASPSDTKQCCSAKCAAQLRIRSGNTRRGYHWTEEERAARASNPKFLAAQGKNAALAAAAAMALPEGQRGAQNRTAKRFILIDPQGNYHKAVSLADWARKNRGLFFSDNVPEDVAVRRICSGFEAIASSMRGVPSRQRPATTYYGWRLASLPEEKNEEDKLFDNEISTNKKQAK